MKSILLSTVIGFVLTMAVSFAAADGCAGSNCDVEWPVETIPQDSCTGANC